MKLFLDCADTGTIKEWMSTGLLDGVTTNPSNLSKQTTDPLKTIKEICKIMGDAPVSVEVTLTNPQAMYDQAHAIAKIAPNVVVKIPCHKEFYGVIHRLAKEGISINITLVFSVLQALMMCKLGVTFISPFVGRLEDVQEDGIQLIRAIRAMIDRYHFTTQLLAASLRSVEHVSAVLLAGADVATLPGSIFAAMAQHPLTDKGMEIFENDWKKLGLSHFP